ncbi:hypothetical protein GA0115251_109522 [Streptomyces sp. TverLS-915]|uniref:hypothetical protein n=1 Tax=Streptomyces sp. TverLS-915 TaxID=1839763 RepID=UPI00081E905E|nr:hypothetical protein [Streptomyces sp. TverLS-915]SCD49041.1 hypothetical protein GA0115251_109522 [Streptomyces sp. TverLS-915]
MSAPLAAAALHHAVLTAHDFRCWCTGQCGRPHKKGGGRCEAEHDGWTSKRGRRIHLIASPADLLTPALLAVTLPAGELRAWCPDCYDATRRAQRKTAAALPTPEQDALFDLSPEN